VLGDGHGFIQAAAVHDNEFQDTLQTGEHVECRTQVAGFVEHWNNDGDS
jgi:hypothetical protein